jgi:hypothetical protein
MIICCHDRNAVEPQLSTWRVPGLGKLAAPSPREKRGATLIVSFRPKRSAAIG